MWGRGARERDECEKGAETGAETGAGGGTEVAHENARVPILRSHLNPGAVDAELDLPQRAGGVALHRGERKTQIFEAVLVERCHRSEHAPDAGVARRDVVEVDTLKRARRQLERARAARDVDAVRLAFTRTRAAARAAATGAETPFPRSAERFSPARFELIGVARVADERPADNLLQQRTREAGESILALEENLAEDAAREAEALAARLAAQRSGAHGVVTRRRIRRRRLRDR